MKREFEIIGDDVSVTIECLNNNKVDIVANIGGYFWYYKGEPEYVLQGNCGVKVKLVGNDRPAFLGDFNKEEAKRICDAFSLFSKKGPIELRHYHVEFED
ncbi:hypothetical protein [Enterovibrio calviensis]|uniref:hypothetical protein n=1 Tax=Enterovibrio calviensis TaxID=91359 RepID=UPI003735E656